MRPVDRRVDSALNRMLVRQGWKPHRQLLFMGGRIGLPRYSLYRKRLKRGEEAFLSWHTAGQLQDILGDGPDVLILDVVGGDGLAYTDNVHDFSEAATLAEALAEDVRAYKSLDQGAKERAYLFGRRLPTFEEAEEFEASGEGTRRSEEFQAKLKRALLR